MKIIGGPALWSCGCLIRWSDWSTWSGRFAWSADPLDPPDQLDPLTRRIRHYQNLWLITLFGAFYKMDSLKLFWMHLEEQTQCVWKWTALLYIMVAPASWPGKPNARKTNEDAGLYKMTFPGAMESHPANEVGSNVTSETCHHYPS